MFIVCSSLIDKVKLYLPHNGEIHWLQLQDIQCRKEENVQKYKTIYNEGNDTMGGFKI